VVSGALDRVLDDDRALVEPRAAGLGDRRSDVGSGDGAEQLAFGARPRRQRHGQVLEGLLDLVGVLQVADRAGLAGTPDGGDLLLRAAGGGDGKALRDEEVAAVAVLHLDQVPGGTEVRDVGGEDELHQRAVLV
jgi:hypothetical protein